MVLRDTLVHLLRDNFTEAKVRAKKSFLLEKQQLQSLAEFRSQTEIVGFLADSPYGPELSKLPDGARPDEVERIIQASVATTVENLEASAKGSMRQFIQEYRKRYDARDLATLLVYKLQGRSWEEYAPTRHPLETIPEKKLRKLYNIDNPADFVEEIGDETLQARLEGMQLEDLTPDRASLVRDIVVGWGEERFYRYVDKKLSGRDSDACLPIVGASIDLSNIAVILRGKLLGLANISAHLVPVVWKLHEKTLEALLATEDVTQALDMISSHRYYRHVLAGSHQKYEETKSLAFLEVLTRQHLSELSRQILLGIPFTVGIVLAFLVLKENEARNLSAIVSGVSGGLKPEQIRPLLAS